MDAGRLIGKTIPDLSLESSCGGKISLAELVIGKTVLYVYPATGAGGRDPAPGWDEIPGAVGCTVQSLGFKNSHDRFRVLGYKVVGVSGQDAAAQAEFAARNGIPFPLLCDRGFALAGALGLATFEAGGQTFFQRIALVVQEGVIRKAFYPIESPAGNSAEVLDWLSGTEPYEH